MLVLSVCKSCPLPLNHSTLHGQHSKQAVSLMRAYTSLALFGFCSISVKLHNPDMLVKTA